MLFRSNPTDSKKYQVKLSSSLDNNNSYQEQIPQIDIQTKYIITSFFSSGSIKDKDYEVEIYLVKDDPILLNFAEFNSFENYEKQELEIEAFYVDGDGTGNYTTKNKLSFNKNIENNIYDYLNILFDKQADIQQNIGVRDIYGDLVNKDDSKC